MSLPRTQSRDGTGIAYRATGEGPALVLSAPSLCSHLHWSGVQPQLARDGRVVSWDYRGHGESDAPSEASAYQLDRAVEDLAAICDSVSEDAPVVLCGWSFGGLLSLCYALRWPGRVRAIALINSGPGFRNPANLERWSGRWERVADRLEAQGVASYLEHPRAREEILGAEPESVAAQRARRGVLASPVHGLAGFARGIAAPQPDLTGRLAEIGCPALVLVGAADTAFQPAARMFEAKLPNVRSAQLEGAGHALVLDAPEAFLSQLQRFLATL